MIADLLDFGHVEHHPTSGPAIAKLPRRWFGAVIFGPIPAPHLYVLGRHLQSYGAEVYQGGTKGAEWSGFLAYAAGLALSGDRGVAEAVRAYTKAGHATPVNAGYAVLASGGSIRPGTPIARTLAPALSRSQISTV